MSRPKQVITEQMVDAALAKADEYGRELSTVDSYAKRQLAAILLSACRADSPRSLIKRGKVDLAVLKQLIDTHGL